MHFTPNLVEERVPQALDCRPEPATRVVRATHVRRMTPGDLRRPAAYAHRTELGCPFFAMA